MGLDDTRGFLFDGFLGRFGVLGWASVDRRHAIEPIFA